MNDYIVGLKKEASIGNTEVQKELDQFQILSKKAMSGDAQAQYELSVFFQNQPSIDNSEQKHEMWLAKSADRGNKEARNALILLYNQKRERFKDVYFPEGKKKFTLYNQELEQLLLKAAQQGNIEDQYKLALFYSENSDAKMQSKAELWMTKVADRGLSAAQIDLGQWYLKGINGVEKNYNKAKAIFQKLADQGNPEGLYYLGLCYRLGYGVTKDFRKAVELNEAAADKGDTKSAIYLTTVYLLGIDDVVSQDRNKFEYYYNQVCSKDKFECLKLHADIMDACGKKYSENDFLNPDSNINPVCRAVALGLIKAMSSLNGR